MVLHRPQAVRATQGQVREHTEAKVLGSVEMRRQRTELRPTPPCSQQLHSDFNNFLLIHFPQLCVFLLEGFYFHSCDWPLLMIKALSCRDMVQVPMCAQHSLTETLSSTAYSIQTGTGGGVGTGL